MGPPTQAKHLERAMLLHRHLSDRCMSEHGDHLNPAVPSAARWSQGNVGVWSEFRGQCRKPVSLLLGKEWRSRLPSPRSIGPPAPTEMNIGPGFAVSLGRDDLGHVKIVIPDRYYLRHLAAEKDAAIFK